MSVSVKKDEIYIVKSGYYLLNGQSKPTYHSFEVKLPCPKGAEWQTLLIEKVSPQVRENPAYNPRRTSDCLYDGSCFNVNLVKLNKEDVKHSLELDGEYGMLLRFNQDATIEKYISGTKIGGHRRQRNKRNTKRTSSAKYRGHRTRRATRRRRV